MFSRSGSGSSSSLSFLVRFFGTTPFGLAVVGFAAFFAAGFDAAATGFFAFDFTFCYKSDGSSHSLELLTVAPKSEPSDISNSSRESIFVLGAQYYLSMSSKACHQRWLPAKREVVNGRVTEL